MLFTHIGAMNNGTLLPAEVADFPFHKPSGNNLLWGSPINAEHGWSDWATPNMPNRVNNVPRWLIDVRDDANIKTVDSIKDFHFLAMIFCPKNAPNAFLAGYIDWVAFAERYDALWVRDYESMNSFDCNSIVIFNTSIVTARCRIAPLQALRLARAA